MAGASVVLGIGGAAGVCQLPGRATSARGRECRRVAAAAGEGGSAIRAWRGLGVGAGREAFSKESVGGRAARKVGLKSDGVRLAGGEPGAGLRLPSRRATRGARRPPPAKAPVSPRAFFTEFAQGIFGVPALDGFGLPDVVEAVRLLPALTTEVIADAAVGIVAIFGAGAFINADGEERRSDELLLQRGGGDDDKGAGRGGRGRGGGGGNNDNVDKWHYEDPDGEAHNFFIRGGSAGVWWILLSGSIAAYNFLIGKSPHWGALWSIVALSIGWGFFLALAVGAVGIVGVFFGVDYLLQWSAGSVNERKNELLSEVGSLVNPEFSTSAPPADARTMSSNANMDQLPVGFQVMGTDAQLVQVELAAGEELSAEPGSMCYMSANVRSITSLKGGFLAGLSRLLAGEPFFLNNFKNISSDGKDGYIALAGKREGDKVIVLDLAALGGEFLCARDSFMCSRGDVDINAAATLMRGQMGLRLFLSSQNTVFMQKLSGTGVACITGNGTVIRQDLKAGQEMVVDARAVVGFSKDIGYQLRMMSSAIAVLFGGEGLFFARLSGPGTFYLQSLPAARQQGNLSDDGEVAV